METANQPKKSYFEPSHTAEHLLNATMVKLFGCPRSRNAHIERKKSKCDYLLQAEPTSQQIEEIEQRVNACIAQALPVTIRMVSREEAATLVDMSKLPDDAGETLRLVHIGEYDTCACIGAHVENTAEIGHFQILTHSYADGVWRLRWRVTAP